MKFLSAEWRHLLLANYVVSPEVLRPFVPVGTNLDPFEGQVFVSLVAFLFDKTRILGVPVPFHRQFEEVNLRFYVTPDRDRAIRAVTFRREIVPKPLIPLIANTLFRENYVSMKMKHGYDSNKLWYAWGNKSQHRFAAKIDSEPCLPTGGSVGEFITEHYWGYSHAAEKTLEYRVEHPPWKSCNIENYEINVDFAELYGNEFAFLNEQQPHNVQYAEGSAVTVSFPRRLKT